MQDEEDANGIDTDTDHTDDPIKVAICGPTEEEAANLEEEGGGNADKRRCSGRPKPLALILGPSMKYK